MAAQTKSSKIPDRPADAVVFVYGNTIIDAPAAHVFRLTSSPSSFSEWNTFAPSAEITSNASDTPDVTPLKLDTKFTMHCQMQPSDTSRQTVKLHVTEVTIPESKGAGSVYRVSWTSEGFAPKFMLRTNRVTEVEQLEDGSCEFRSWEAQSGALSYVVNRLYGKILQDRFQDWADDLKKYAEKTKDSVST